MTKDDPPQRTLSLSNQDYRDGCTTNGPLQDRETKNEECNLQL